MDRLVGRAGGTRSPVDVDVVVDVRLVVLVVLVALVGLDVGVVAVMVDVTTVECMVIVTVYTRAPIFVSNFKCTQSPEEKMRREDIQPPVTHSYPGIQHPPPNAAAHCVYPA